MAAGKYLPLHNFVSMEATLAIDATEETAVTTENK
jgi:hypothetical protein